MAFDILHQLLNSPEATCIEEGFAEPGHFVLLDEGGTKCSKFGIDFCARVRHHSEQYCLLP
jgi:hypothetical protein